jgi:surface protein
MAIMFSGCSELDQTLNGWDLSKVKYDKDMFKGCK